MPNTCKAIFQFLANFETYRVDRDPGSDFKEIEWQGGNQSPTYRANKYHKARQKMGFVMSKEEERTHDDGESKTASHMAEFRAANGNVLAKLGPCTGFVPLTRYF